MDLNYQELYDKYFKPKEPVIKPSVMRTKPWVKKPKQTKPSGDVSLRRYPVQEDNPEDVLDWYKRNLPGTPS